MGHTLYVIFSFELLRTQTAAVSFHNEWKPLALTARHVDVFATEDLAITFSLRSSYHTIVSICAFAKLLFTRQHASGPAGQRTRGKCVVRISETWWKVAHATVLSTFIDTHTKRNTTAKCAQLFCCALYLMYSILCRKHFPVNILEHTLVHLLPSLHLNFIASAICFTWLAQEYRARQRKTDSAAFCRLRCGDATEWRNATLL